MAETVRTISDKFIRLIFMLSESNATVWGSVICGVTWWRSGPTDMVSIVNIV